MTAREGLTFAELVVDLEVRFGSERIHLCRPRRVRRQIQGISLMPPRSGRSSRQTTPLRARCRGRRRTAETE